MKVRKKKPNRHAFRFKMSNGKIVTFWAKVIPAKRDVYLPLKAEHVRESIHLKGVGNTQTCAMAVCASRSAECFPHPVEGYIDWFYTRAYVVSKVNRDGMPSECFEYMHSDKIAQLNDTRGGQRKLLEQLEATENAERIIHLRPVKVRDPKYYQQGAASRESSRDGSRTRSTRVARGAKLRFAVARAGGVPA
jgi:hypothetical protein